MIETADASLLDALRDVEDPEIPISIVDMGLVVGASRTGRRAEVQITFTAMGCPAMDMIIDDVRARLLAEPDIDDVHVEIVWEPIWTKDRLSQTGRDQLREWGISV